MVVLNQDIQRLGEPIGLLVCDQSHDFESSEYRLVPGKRLMYRSHDTPASISQPTFPESRVASIAPDTLSLGGCEVTD